jgi:hypothetical protein
MFVHHYSSTGEKLIHAKGFACANDKSMCQLIDMQYRSNILLKDSSDINIKIQDLKKKDFYL